MSQPFQEQMEAALADLRGQQTRIQSASRQLAQVTGKATSKDRAVEAVVDSQGKLTSLKLNGTGYRKLAPAELAARIVETVRTAQDAASREAFESLAGLMPTGFGGALGAAAPADGSWDIEAMFDAAARAVQEPLFTDGRNGNAS